MTFIHCAIEKPCREFPIWDFAVKTKWNSYGQTEIYVNYYIMEFHFPRALKAAEWFIVTRTENVIRNFRENKKALRSFHLSNVKIYCFRCWKEKLFRSEEKLIVVCHSPDCQTHRCCKPMKPDWVRTKRQPTLLGETKWILVMQPQCSGQWRRRKTDRDGLPILSPKRRDMCPSIRTQPQSLNPTMKKLFGRKRNRKVTESISRVQMSISICGNFHRAEKGWKSKA